MKTLRLTLTPEQALCAILDLAPEQLPDWNAPWSEADQTAWEALQASVPPPQPEAVRYKRLARQFATQGLSEEWRQIFQRAGILRIPEDS